MAVNLRSALSGVFLALTAAGLAYSAAELVALRRFRKRAHPPRAEPAPPITILKPLHGDEPELYENLRSFCVQDYPRYQVIFGARDPRDPALAVARRLISEFPSRDLSIASGDANRSGANPKIANLSGMIGHAEYDLLAIVDSDMRVGPDYLWDLAASFRDRRTGAATCLYTAVPVAGAASEAGALIVNDQFMPSVLVARMLEPLEYCFGSTMAVRRDVLERIGGLRALGGYLADDFMLGKKVSDAGYEIALCPHLVEMTVHDRDFYALWQHQLRWQRTVRASRPRGFAGAVVTYVVPLSLVFACLARSKIAAGIVIGFAGAVRALVHRDAQKTFPARRTIPWQLVPVADAVAFGTWIAAFFGARVSWRNEAFGVEREGRLSE